MTTVLILLLLLIFLSLWGGFYAVVKQQGRILLRLDQLEQGGKPETSGEGMAVPQPEPEGLAVGTEFPAFRRPDLAGKAVGLEEFRGRRVLLLHWNFECGFCESIASDLGALGSSLEKANVALVLLAMGEEAANRQGAAEHGLKCPILLLKGGETPKPFEHLGTPVGYLLDEAGRVDAPLASGADRVLALAQALVSGADVSSGSAPLTGTTDEPQNLQNSSVPSSLDPKSEIGDSKASHLSSTSATLQAPRRHQVKLPGFLVRGEVGLGDVIKRLTSAFGIKPSVGCERRAHC